jgi:transcriptional regulator with XRE-family HTH domain
MEDDIQGVRLRIGRRVRQLRLLRGLSQEKLAERVGNQYKHIGQIERGEVNVGIDILASIAASLSVDVSNLVEPTAADTRDQRTYLLTHHDVEQLEQALRVVERLQRRRTRQKPD